MAPVDDDHTPAPRSLGERLARIEERLRGHGATLRDVKDEIDTLVTRSEFDPVKRAVYYVLGLILASFIGSLFALLTMRFQVPS
jgi:hypothetical protein